MIQRFDTERGSRCSIEQVQPGFFHASIENGVNIIYEFLEEIVSEAQLLERIKALENDLLKERAICG